VQIEGIDADTSGFSIEIHELPEFAFESDTLKITEYPYTINPGVVAESYLWNTGETAAAITINTNGEYWLKVTDINACTFTDTVFVKQISGIFDEWGAQISIYPNPTNNYLTINIPALISKTAIELLDVQGRIIKKINHAQEKQTIDVSDWRKGVYLVRIFNEKHHALFQVIIK
jgi:hypothetical protein